jgi:hypothetical protein
MPLCAYELSGLNEADALNVAERRRDEALSKLQAARREFDDWDAMHARLLSDWANRHYGRASQHTDTQGK